jgi:hypothetical protein
VPEWADREAEAAAAAAGAGAGPAAAPPPAPPDAARRGALGALIALAPLPGGDALLAEVYSPHLDTYQRLLVLDTLCAAARELSDPRAAPRLEAGPGRGPPRLAATPSAAPALAGPSAGGGRSGAVVAPGMREASTKVSRPVSLRKLQEQSGSQSGGQSGGPQTFRNRFSPVALRWASALLRSCDQPRHGVDLFGRDGLLLGRLLVTLGTFMECVDQVGGGLKPRTR